MKFPYFALCLVLVTASAMAAPPSEEDAGKLLTVLQLEKSHKERLDALDKLNEQSFAEKIGMGEPLTAEQREAVDTAVATASQIVRTELAWKLIKPDLIRIIQETFDDDDLSSISSLYMALPGDELAEKLRNFGERYRRYTLDRLNAIGPRADAEINLELTKLRIRQLDTTKEPLAHLRGNWDITTFLVGGGHLGISGCGLVHQPARMVSHSDRIVEVTSRCKDDSEYVFKLKRDKDHQSYRLTVKNKEGINVVNFPLSYLGSQGWRGVAQQVVDGKAISLVAVIAPIEGKAWYGWATWIRPAEEADVDYDKAKTPYLKVDFTRNK